MFLSVYYDSEIVFGEGNGNPLQYSCLGNPMDGEAWWATVYGVTENRTRLSDFFFLFLRMVLITASYTMFQTSVHRSSGTLSITSNPLNLLVTSTVNHKGFDLGHT